MTAIAIRFDTPWLNAVSPLKIRFTDEPTPEVPEVPISPGTIGLMCGIGIAVGPSVMQQLSIESATQSHATQIRPQWQVGHVAQMVTAQWQAKALMGITASVVWRWNNLVPCNLDVLWLVPDLHAVQSSGLWLSPEAVQTSVAMPWRQPAATGQIIALGDMQGELVATEVKLAHSNIRAAGDMQGIAWGPHAPRWVCTSKYRPPVGKITLRFNEPLADDPNPVVLRFTASPNYCYWDDGGGLIGTNPSLPTIDFKIPIEPQIRRSYLMTPTISCIRLSDNLPIVLRSISMQQSRTQWAPTATIVFSAKGDAERAAGQAVKISVNGYDFYLLIESIDTRTTFGNTTYSASARGLLAELAAPYKKAVNFVNQTDRSFMGLAGDIVANTGWTVATTMTDYTVPATAWSYQGKTPVEALQLMATAIGAMLDVNGETKTITFIPKWPVSPWLTTTATPDVALPSSVILEHSERTDLRPAANAVLVRGEQIGVARKVKLTGSDGLEFASDVIDKLITDGQAARMRGTHELAEMGDKLVTQLRTKLMDNLPPLRPGMLIGVTYAGVTYKATCDSWALTAACDNQGKVTVNQSLTLVRNAA